MCISFEDAEVFLICRAVLSLDVCCFNIYVCLSVSALRAYVFRLTRALGCEMFGLLAHLENQMS